MHFLAISFITFHYLHLPDFVVWWSYIPFGLTILSGLTILPGPQILIFCNGIIQVTIFSTSSGPISSEVYTLEIYSRT